MDNKLRNTIAEQRIKTMQLRTIQAIKIKYTAQ